MIHTAQVTCFFVVATLAGCANQAQQKFERPPAPVVVSTAVAQDVSNYMDALGKIVARETVAIQPQVSTCCHNAGWLDLHLTGQYCARRE